jgi:hypothetical protein
MRISSDNDDSGYTVFAEAKHVGQTIRVYLNGEEVRKCAIADDQAGLVKRAVLNEQGQLQVDPNNPEIIWEEVVHGDVKIVIA